MASTCVAQACCTTRIPTNINGPQAGAETTELPLPDPGVPALTNTPPLNDLQLVNMGAQIQFEANIVTLGKYFREKLQVANVHSPGEAIISGFILDIINDVSRNMVIERNTEEVVLIDKLIVPVVSTYADMLLSQVIITSNI